MMLRSALTLHNLYPFPPPINWSRLHSCNQLFVLTVHLRPLQRITTWDDCHWPALSSFTKPHVASDSHLGSLFSWNHLKGGAQRASTRRLNFFVTNPKKEPLSEVALTIRLTLSAPSTSDRVSHANQDRDQPVHICAGWFMASFYLITSLPTSKQEVYERSMCSFHL